MKHMKHAIKRSAIHSENPVNKGCIPGEDPYQRPYTYLTKTFGKVFVKFMIRTSKDSDR